MVATEIGGEGVRQPALVSGGKYHVLTELGRGGMAIVEAAISRGPAGFTKLVVLKKAREELAEQRDAVRTFLNEAKISARMNHPNVVQVYEVYEDQGLPVMVMEYLEGQSFALLLRRHCDDPSSPPALPLSVLCRTLEGLQYAHSLADFDGRPLNLIHRDVSPQNIMVTYDGQVKLLDFGIAKLDNLRGETKTGIIKGKLGYMPLEQVEGRTLDNRADLFPIGVMIWESVARRRMWENHGDAMVIKRILQKDIPCLRDAVPDVDEELLRICKKATAVDRDERYANARELLADLQSFLQGWGGVATEQSISQWINAACSDLKKTARLEMDTKLALFSKQMGSGVWKQDGDSPSMPPPRTSRGVGKSARRRRAEPDASITNEGFGGQTLSARFDAPRRRWAALGAAVALGAGLLFLRSAPVDPMPPPSGSPRLAAAPSVAPRAAELDGSLGVSARASSSSTGPSSAASVPASSAVASGAVASGAVASSAEASGSVMVSAAPDPERTPAPAATAARGAAPRAGARPGPQRPVSASPARPAAVPASEVTAPPPAPSACDAPFAVDSSGIKRYRRECLGR